MALTQTWWTVPSTISLVSVLAIGSWTIEVATAGLASMAGGLATSDRLVVDRVRCRVRSRASRSHRSPGHGSAGHGRVAADGVRKSEDFGGRGLDTNESHHIGGVR